ncbi:MAG: Na+/H+ antiporter subunit E [Lachnospiraceae bacterium]|nr:Na+/H+ antiporter subunit E [Lachnospiraceae bacterium]
MYVLYFLLWIVFNGNFTLEIGIFGLVIAALMLAFSCKFMGYSLKKEVKIYKKALLFFKYAYVLVKEIVKANFGVIRLILTQKEEIEPTLVTFRSDLKSDPGKALLANAITLTPGTITVSLEGDQYTVHCLDESLAEGMQDSVFVEYIRRLEE